MERLEAITLTAAFSRNQPPKLARICMVPKMFDHFQLFESFSGLRQPSHGSDIPPHRSGIIIQLISAEVCNSTQHHLEPARTDPPKDKLGICEVKNAWAKGESRYPTFSHCPPPCQSQSSGLKLSLQPWRENGIEYVESPLLNILASFSFGH